MLHSRVSKDFKRASNLLPTETLNTGIFSTGAVKVLFKAQKRLVYNR